MLFALQPSNAVFRARYAAKRPAAVCLTLFKLKYLSCRERT